ncbi:MAG: hypothetical protein ABIN80_03625 [Dyadobacter sp.]|uniref:hypothetical protein n=1 Tax=Dyadobacter sp. TaxID=1914288 RepID=UPI0032671FB0
MKKNKEGEMQGVKGVNELDENDPNSTNGKAGWEEAQPLPNDPAANAKKTSPEEDSGAKEDTKLSAGSR